MKTAFQGSQGQLALFLGNKGDTPLERLVCAMPPVPQLAIQVGPVPKRPEPNKQMRARRPTAAATQAPLLLQSCTFPGACAQVPLMVACVAPFATPPRLQLGDACGAQALNRSLALPMVAVKFCTPPDAAVPRETFFQRWRALPGAPAHPRARCH